MYNDDIRKSLKTIRYILKESSEKNEGVPYTQHDEIYQNSIKSAKEQFGASFRNIKNPMFYYEQDGDVTLNGEIPEMNNAKFQFRYKDPTSIGCFFWSGNDSMVLSDENIKKLSRILGVYKNWKKDLSTIDDLRPLSMKNN